MCCYVVGHLSSFTQGRLESVSLGGFALRRIDRHGGVGIKGFAVIANQVESNQHGK